MKERSKVSIYLAETHFCVFVENLYSFTPWLFSLFDTKEITPLAQCLGNICKELTFDCVNNKVDMH